MNNLLQSGRNKLVNSIAFVLAFIVVVGCEDAPYYRPPQQQGNKVAFDLLVLDQADADGSAFPEGTDIKFVLKFISDPTKYVQWHKDNGCRLFTSKDFLLVYKLDENSATPSSYFPVGLPYQTPVSCTAINIPSSLLFGTSVILSLNWSNNPDNEPLTPGRYFTIANFDLPIEGKSERFELRRDFEIY